MRVPCEEFLAECTWNNVKFDCCTEFQELRKTGVGYCIAMNTFHLKPGVRFFVNRTVKYGDLIVDIRLDAKMKRYLFAGFTVRTCFFNNISGSPFNKKTSIIIELELNENKLILVGSILVFVDINMIYLIFNKNSTKNRSINKKLLYLIISE